MTRSRLGRPDGFCGSHIFQGRKYDKNLQYLTMSRNKIKQGLQLTVV